MHLRHRSHSDMRGLSGLMMSPSSFSRACARLSHLGNGVVLLLAALSLFPLTVHAAEQLGTLRFATPGPTITTLPMQIASEKGMDKEEGFTAAFTNTTGSVAIKAMLAGDFDVTLSVGGSLTAGVSGAPTKVIYVHVAKPLYFLYGREGVANVKALEGLRVGVDATGGSGEFALRRAMQAAGADPSKATFLAMGFQNTPPSLIAGAVDAAVLTPPTEFQLAKSGKTFVNLGFLGDYAAGLTGGVGTTDKMIRERPNALRAVLRAQAKAHRFVLENRAETIAVMSRFLNMSADDAAKSYDSTVLPHYSKTGDIPVAVQQAVVDEQGRMLKLSKTPQLPTLFDFSFIGN
jgi:NitT/TauT family transport system substrate-binding protein